MGIEELQRRSELAHRLRQSVENQKLLLDTLYLASQQLWSDDEMRSRCEGLLREVARETVKTARQWMDLAGGKSVDEVTKAEPEEEARDETFPF